LVNIDLNIHTLLDDFIILQNFNEKLVKIITKYNLNQILEYRWQFLSQKIIIHQIQLKK
jgi:hypothetical protein